MSGKWILQRARRCAAAAVALLVLTWPATAWTQTAAPPEPASPAQPTPAAAAGPEGPKSDPDVVQTGCSTCGGGLFNHGCASCGSCGAAPCYPGQFCHPCCHGDGHISRFFGGIMDCLCCKDPCYEPHWVAAANAAFWADPARPVTQMRLRWDAGYDFSHPDRAAIFMATPGPKGMLDANGLPLALSRSIRYGEFSMYTEGATEKIGIFTEIPYRRVEWDDPLIPDASGFSDMNVGTKTLLCDCELLQLAFQFKTYIPIGLSGKGLGTGHVTLEPSLLWALKLAPDTYFQAQTAYWIPVSGGPEAGDMFHYHLALNHVLWRPCCGVELIGTAELNGFAVLDGASYVTTVNTQNAAGEMEMVDIFERARTHILSLGPGLRVNFCDKLDLGLGTAFTTTENNFAKQLYRAEFRWRF